MRVAAMLGPKAKPHHVAAFRLPDTDLRVVERVSGNPGYDAALVFGGDGTIHRHLRSLHESGIPMLPVPVGSGNDFARQIGIPDFAASLSLFRRFCAGAVQVREVDLGVIRRPGGAAGARTGGKSAASGDEEHLYCCIGGVGLDSEANRIANRMRPWWRAHGGYAIAALREITGWQPVNMRIECEGVHRMSAAGAMTPAEARASFAEPATMIVFANAQTYGDGMRLAPHASIDDGRLDVVFVRRTSRRRLFTFFPTVFFGRHLRLPEVAWMQAERICVATDPVLDVYADGERICPTPIEVTVRRRALRVISG